jgi:arylsulfatase
LLITVDALRADAAREMRSYRRLASDGAEFMQHVTTSPWTLPSVASLLTGLAPAEHGAGESLSSRSLVQRSPLGRDVPTLAGMLGAQGLVTHAVVTNPYLGARYGIDRGFCTFENVSMEGEAVRALGQTTQLRLARALVPRWLPSDRAPEVRARAERWLERHGGRPFFLWLHFLDPHAPYGDRDGSPTSLVLDLMAFQRDGATGTPFRGVGLARAGEYRPGPEERRRIRALYQEDVDTVDRELGRLLDYLDAHGLRRRTAIVLTADHGEEFWDHGALEHGRTLYEEVVRVPLVVAVPGRARAMREDLTTVLDVAPTMLALAGVGAPPLAGADLFDVRATPTRVLPLGQTLFGEDWTGYRTATRKYVRSEAGEERSYDLASDPGERRNVAWGASSGAGARGEGDDLPRLLGSDGVGVHDEVVVGRELLADFVEAPEVVAPVAVRLRHGGGGLGLLHAGRPDEPPDTGVDRGRHQHPQHALVRRQRHRGSVRDDHRPSLLRDLVDGRPDEEAQVVGLGPGCGLLGEHDAHRQERAERYRPDHVLGRGQLVDDPLQEGLPFLGRGHDGGIHLGQLGRPGDDLLVDVAKPEGAGDGAAHERTTRGIRRRDTHQPRRHRGREYRRRRDGR